MSTQPHDFSASTRHAPVLEKPVPSPVTLERETKQRHTRLLQPDLSVQIGGRRDSLNHVKRRGDVVILKPLGIPLGAPEWLRWSPRKRKTMCNVLNLWSDTNLLQSIVVEFGIVWWNDHVTGTECLSYAISEHWKICIKLDKHVPIIKVLCDETPELDKWTTLFFGLLYVNRFREFCR